ncbi:hypothetical protein BS17DRAFT_780439 [Gyrodon lividus]|nr:hypothetical protein BS17DRAFT_780439 [Gyrodon lividus]
MCPKDTNELLESGFCTGTLANEYDIVLARRPGEERGYLIDLAVREEQDVFNVKQGCGLEDWGK